MILSVMHSLLHHKLDIIISRNQSCTFYQKIIRQPQN